MLRRLLPALAFLCLLNPCAEAASGRAPREKPRAVHLVGESLTGLLGGVGGAYLGGLIGSTVSSGESFLVPPGFIEGAAIGYPVGTFLGIQAYAMAMGLERNP